MALIKLFLMAFLAIALPLATTAAGAEVVQVFGLPLGGRPHPAIKVCTFNEIGSDKVLCLVSKPFVSKDGGKLGTLNIPEFKLPEWASYSSAKISLEKNGTISGIFFDTKNAHLADILASIEERFGQPTTSKLTGTRIPMATWELENIFIHASQYDDKCCEVSFRTPEDIAKQRAYWAEQDKKEKSRPRTP